MSFDLVNYFAFGSNLSSARLLQRIPLATRYCIASLAGHRLCWHKKGTDRSGKCDIVETGDARETVYGVVYRMTEEDKLALDLFESAGVGYQRREIQVSANHGDLVDVFTYFALEIEPGRQPYHWYKEHVLRGALEHGLPPQYVEHIRATPSVDDHDAERHRHELSIYADQP